MILQQILQVRLEINFSIIV